jgi:hypothetical protein
LFTPKFGRKNAGTRRLSRLCQSRKIDVNRFKYNSRIGYIRVTSADSNDELRLAPGNYMSDSTKREKLESKLS